MPEFLSPAWVSALDDAARAAPGLARLGAVGPVVIEQRVLGTPRGDVVYHVVLDAAGARVESGPAVDPTLVVVTPYLAARDLHVGGVDVRTLLRAGSVKIAGSANALVARADALAALDDVFAPVRAATTFADLPGGT
jgi:hypothetical protein